MKVFAFDADDARRRWRQQDWLHLRPGVTDEFLDLLESMTRSLLAERALAGPGLAGAKDQFLFDPPPGVDVFTEIYDTVAAATGLARDTLTLSERHIKAYLSDAEPYPTAHKDRLASTVAMGISVAIPEGSHVVLWPGREREENPFMAPHLRAGLEPDQLPEVVLAGDDGVVIHDEPGDVLLFPGASTWHLRRHSADSVLLYLKFNDFGADPLGEAPDARARRAESHALLDRLDGDVAAVLSGRFEAIIERRSRRGWMTLTLAQVFGDPPFPVDEVEVEVLRRASRPTSVADLLAGGATRRSIERLVRRDALDLVEITGAG